MTEIQIEIVTNVLEKLTALVIVDYLLASIALVVAILAVVRAGEDR